MAAESISYQDVERWADGLLDVVAGDEMLTWLITLIIAHCNEMEAARRGDASEEFSIAVNSPRKFHH